MKARRLLSTILITAICMSLNINSGCSYDLFKNTSVKADEAQIIGDGSTLGGSSGEADNVTTESSEDQTTTENSEVTTTEQSTTEAKPVKNGLKKENGKYYFYKNGKKIKNSWKVIKGYKYYFKANGQMATLSTKIKGKYFIFNKKGQLMTAKKVRTIKLNGDYYRVTAKGKAVTGFSKNTYYAYKNGKLATGLTRIKKHYYYFTAKGILKKGTYKIKNVKYYTNSKGAIEVTKKGSTYYYGCSDKKLSSDKVYQYQTVLKARKIVAEITTSRMTMEQKKLVCFKWVMKHGYALHRSFPYGNSNWPAIYANDHFNNIGGDCHSDASCFAYLAYALGYDNIYVCADTNDPKSGKIGGHSWCRVEGRLYDPLFAECKNFAGSYGVWNKTGYRSYAPNNVKIDPDMCIC